MERRNRILAAFFALAWAPELLPQEPALRSFTPQGALAVLEVPDAGAAATALLEFATPLIAALPETQRTAVSLGRLALQGRLGMTLEEAARVLGGNGLACSFRAAAGRLQVLAVLRPGDPERARELLEILPGQVRHRFEGDLIVLAPARDPLELAGEDGREPGPRRSDAHAVLRLDLAMLRRLRPALAEPERRMDPAARLLLAPLIPALRDASELTVELVAGESLELRATLDAGVANSSWKGLLAKDGSKRVLPRFDAGAVLSVDRSLRALLSEPERFLGEEQAVRARAFLSVADQLVGQRASFTDDLLGALREPLHLVVTVPEENDGDPRPPLLLPAFALVAAVERPELEEVLRRTAQVLSIISNKERGRLDKDPFRVRATTGDGWRGLTSALPAWRGPGAPPAEQALTPTLLFGNGHAVLATTATAAERALAACALPGEEVAGDLLRLSGEAAARMVARNFDVLCAARVLDEGEDPEQATRYWRTVEFVVAPMELEVRLQPGVAHTEMVLGLRRNP